MIVDPVQMLATAKLPLASSSLASLPTVVPDPLPSIDYQVATKAGTDTLWVVFIIMLISGFVFTGLAWKVPTSKRLYHIITSFIVFFAALSYFAMATKHGVSFHEIVHYTKKESFHPLKHVVMREVYWARYVDWSITTPLLLLDLSLIAGISGADILITIVADLVMILTGLFAAFGAEDTPQKWGWYAIACLAYLVVIYQLVVKGRATAVAKGGKVGRFFAAIGGFTLVIWTIYPIVWGIADGSRRFNVNQEIIAYAVLDVLAKPVFGSWLIYTHKAIPETNIDIGGFWANGLSNEGAIRIGDDEEGA